MGTLSPIGDLKSPIGDLKSPIRDNLELGIYESGNADSENKSPISDWITIIWDWINWDWITINWGIEIPNCGYYSQLDISSITPSLSFTSKECVKNQP